MKFFRYIGRFYIEQENFTIKKGAFLPPPPIFALFLMYFGAFLSFCEFLIKFTIRKCREKDRRNYFSDCLFVNYNLFDFKKFCVQFLR